MPPKIKELIVQLEKAGPDQGSAPGLIYGGCHGDNEQAVFAELCQIVEEAIQSYKLDNQPLPPPTAGRDYANRLQLVA